MACGDNFRLEPDKTLTDVIALFDEVAKETEAVVAGMAAPGQSVPVPRTYLINQLRWDCTGNCQPAR